MDKNKLTVATGVRYITEDLIKKLSKQDHLELIVSLNLTLGKEGGKKIKYIENLEKLKKLQTLNLASNAIEKIEKLDKLTKLRELSLAYNKITKIENIESLVNLQVLNFTGNQIEHIPPWIGKKLKALRTLKLAKNELQSIQEFTKLRPLKDLTVLTVADNPVSLLPHCRSFLVFHLSTLESLDSQRITLQERHASATRFGQEEIEKLTKQLEETETKYSNIEKGHNRSLGELEERERTLKGKEQKLKEYGQTIKELHRELDTKNDLLKRKTAELTRACEKHYELEQELAFYKIDQKFDQLSRPPRPLSTDEESLVGDDGLIGGESPYIGKGRFKQNLLAREKALQKGKPSPGSYGHVGEPDKSGGADGSYIDSELQASIQSRQAQIADLDMDLAEKQESSHQAQDRLERLQEELVRTNEQLVVASEELHKINEAQADRHLTEDDKQHIRSKLSKKIDKVHELRDATHGIEQDMQYTEDEIRRQEQEIGQMRSQLRRMNSSDALYRELQDKVAEKEEQLDLDNRQYYNLQGHLEKVLGTISKETSDMKRLEQELREGQVQQNDQLKEELESIISGLQTYLQEVQGRASKQKDELDGLWREREELVSRLNDLEGQREAAEAQTEEISLLREKLTDLQEHLAQERDLNDSLTRRLDESRLHDQEEAEITVQLHDAEDEIDQLRRALSEADRKIENERDNFNRTLEEEKKKSGLLKRKAKAMDAKDEEIAMLEKQLGELQKSNIKYQDQLWDIQQKFKDQKDHNIDPDTLRRRLGDVLEAVKTGKEYVEDHSEDEVGYALRDLQGDVERELDKSEADVKRVTREKEKAEDEVKRLRDAITQAQEDERDRADRAIQNMLDGQRRETDRLRDQLERLKAELEREKRNNRPLPKQYLQPSTKASTTSISTSTATGTTVTSVTASSTEGSTSEEESTIPSSQWSNKRRQLYDTFTPEEQELFDELQQEIELLRKLLAKRDKKAAEKAIQAIDAKAEKLQGLINKRNSTGTSSALFGQNQSKHAKQLSKKKGQSIGVGGDEYRTSSGDRTGYSKKPYDDPRLHVAVKDLSKAHKEIDVLEQELREKNAMLRKELKKSDKKDGTVVSQEEELNMLHDILEEQKNEINRLNNMVDRLSNQGPDQYQGYEDQVQDFLRAADNLRSSLSQQRPRFDRISPHRQQGPQRGRDYVDPRSQGYVDAGGYQGDRAIAPGAARTPGGIPVPTFYDPDGRPTILQQDAQQYHQPPLAQFGGQTAAQQQFGAPVISQDPGQYGHAGMQQHASQFMPQSGQSHIPSGIAPQAGMLQDQAHQPGTDQQDVIQGFMGPDGQLYVPSGQPGAANLTDSMIMTPRTRKKSRSMSDLHNLGFHASTTPMAGSIMGQAGSTPLTPNASYVHPTMMSTPIAQTDNSGNVRGILKKGGLTRSKSEEQLVCNVPEHHDLEDYIEKLQNKIRRLKAKLQDTGETSAQNDSRRVLFEDDVDKKTIRRLQAELENRRAELEGLDLAIENQKEQLGGMRETEKKLLAQRQAARDELYQVRNGKTGKRKRRKAFLDGKLDFDDPYESDFDYEYNPRLRGTRSEYLQQEIDCLEQTLAKRRAELREADRLLQETELDLAAAQKEARSTIQQYDSAKLGYQNTVKDTDEIEKRAYSAGVKLIKTEERVANIEGEFKQLQDARIKQQDLLKEIQKIISSKDQEFNNLKLHLSKGEQRLAEIKSEIAYAESQQENKLALMKESERLISERKQELEEYKRQINCERNQLHSLDLEIDKKSTDLELVEATLMKRHSQLQNADREVSQDIYKKQMDMQKLETELEAKKNQRQRFEKELIEKQQKLRKIKDDIDYEEKVLENVAVTTTKHRGSLENVEQELQSQISQLETLQSQCDQRNLQLEHIQREREEEEKEVQRLRAESVQKTAEIDTIRHEIQRQKENMDSLANQRKTLEVAVEKLRSDKSYMENETQNVHKRLVDMKKTKMNLEETISRNHSKLSHLDKEVKQIESLLGEKGERRSSLERELFGLKTNVEEGRSELDSINGSLRDAEGSVRHLERELQQLISSKEDLLQEYESLQQETNKAHESYRSKVEEYHSSIAIMKAENEDLYKTYIKTQSDLDSICASYAQIQQEVNKLSAKNECQKREAEMRGRTEDKFSTLEGRIRNLGHEIQRRESDKAELAEALDRSFAEVQNLRKLLTKERKETQRRLHGNEIETAALRQELDDRHKELKYFKEKAGKEVTELEGIAQAHSSRANRLSDELSYLRADYMEVKRQLDNQKQLAERDKELGDTIRELKSDLTYELKANPTDLEKSQAELLGELESMYTQKHGIERHVENVRNNLYHIRTTDAQQQSDSFAAHQKMLKQQIQQRMSRQVEAMQAQKQLSQSNILSLQNKLSSLEQVMSQVEPKCETTTPLSDVVAAAKETLRSLTPVKDSMSLGHETASQGLELHDQRSLSFDNEDAFNPPSPLPQSLSPVEELPQITPQATKEENKKHKEEYITSIQISTTATTTVAPQPKERPSSRIPTPTTISTTPKASGERLGSKDSGIMVDNINYNDFSSEDSEGASTSVSHIPRPRHAYSPHRHSNKSRSRSGSRSRLETHSTSSKSLAQSDKTDSN